MGIEDDQGKKDLEQHTTRPKENMPPTKPNEVEQIRKDTGDAAKKASNT